MDGSKHLIALDLGDKRIGVAIASYSAKLPSPLVTLANDDNLATELKKIITEHKVDKIIIGLPRSLEGNETQQTRVVQTMADKLKNELRLPLEYQDEALSSVRAQEEIEQTKGHKSRQRRSG